MECQPAAIRPEATLTAALELLWQENVEELYVTDALGRLLGVLPDYELLKATLNGDGAEQRVEDLMTRSLVVFAPTLPVLEAARAFRDARHRHVAVAVQGRLVGRNARTGVLRALADSTRRNLRVLVSESPGESSVTAVPPNRPRFLDNQRTLMSIFQE
jgi:CBS domain-containing protein